MHERLEHVWQTDDERRTMNQHEMGLNVGRLGPRYMFFFLMIFIYFSLIIIYTTLALTGEQRRRQGRETRRGSRRVALVGNY